MKVAGAAYVGGVGVEVGLVGLRTRVSLRSGYEMVYGVGSEECVAGIKSVSKSVSHYSSQG